MKRHILGITALTLFILSIPAANWAFQLWGVVPIVGGLEAPAASLVIGAAFLARDYLHRTWGVAVCLAAIVVGTVLSFLLASPILALASAGAFLVSETADLTVLQWLRSKGWSRAVAASNVVAALLDSLVFLWVLDALALMPGQVAAKLGVTILWLAARELVGRDRSRYLEVCEAWELCPAHMTDSAICRDDELDCEAGRA